MQKSWLLFLGVWQVQHNKLNAKQAFMATPVSTGPGKKPEQPTEYKATLDDLV